MYAEDFDGYLQPYGGAVMSRVFPYVKNTQVFRCPSSNLVQQNDPNMTSIYSTDYGVPGSYNSSSWPRAIMLRDGPPQLLAAIPQASLTCLLAENKYAGTPANYGFDQFLARDFPAKGIWNGLPQPERHFDGSNYAYADGHVKWLKSETAIIPNAQNNAIKFHWPYNS